MMGVLEARHALLAQLHCVHSVPAQNKSEAFVTGKSQYRSGKKVAMRCAQFYLFANATI
jgi:hypothetical protein